MDKYRITFILDDGTKKSIKVEAKGICTAIDEAMKQRSNKPWWLKVRDIAKAELLKG